MSDVLLKIIVAFFSVYGAVELSKEIICYFFFQKNNCKFTIVVKVKDCAETLEYTVRTLVKKYLMANCGDYIPDILIVDMGSSDDTRQIALKLCNDYCFINCVSYDDFIKIK